MSHQKDIDATPKASEQNQAEEEKKRADGSPLLDLGHKLYVRICISIHEWFEWLTKFLMNVPN